MKELTYQEVYDKWGRSRYKSVFYKDRQLFIILVPKEIVTLPFPYESPYRRPFYVGTFKYTPTGEFWSKRTSFESIHYDKVVSKFQRFVDEYCTNWVSHSAHPNPIDYQGYRILIKKERDKDFYLGYVHFHKNSTFKHIADTREEVERCCRDRIDRVLYEKEKVTKFTQDFNKVGSGLALASAARKYKIQELEQLLARISTQLEELKKEEDSIVYKGVVLEVSRGGSGNYYKGTLQNLDEQAPFLEYYLEDLKKSFESYVDKLEKQYNLYRRLTGQE